MLPHLDSLRSGGCLKKKSRRFWLILIAVVLLVIVGYQIIRELYVEDDKRIRTQLRETIREKYPERAEGQSLDYILLDELRLVRYVDLALKVCQRRLRGSANTRRLGYPIGAWITTTPDEPGSDLHKFVEDPGLGIQVAGFSE